MLSCRAGVFPMPEIGIALTVPDGWTHKDDPNEFGFVLVPPSDQLGPNKLRKVCAHLSGHHGTDLAEELELAIQKVTETAPAWGASTDRKSFLGSSEVRTAGGLVGLKGSFGYKQSDGTLRTTIDKYYFRNQAGKIFCVCAYVYGPRELAQSYEDIILQGLTLLSPEA